MNHCKIDGSTSNGTPTYIGAYMTSQQLSVLRVVKGGNDVRLCHKHQNNTDYTTVNQWPKRENGETIRT